ncbi:MAG: DUF998 domain-containing protein [bacterium]|nr:DUF998 domain-containing protein [bacterium]
MIWLASSLTYLLCEAIAAGGFPGYSYAANFISDLGVPYKGYFAGRELNSTLAVVMNAGFILHGLLFALSSILVLPAIRPQLMARIALIALALAHALGSLLIAVVHSGNRELESGMNALHLIGATLAIVGGNLAVLTLAIHLRNFVAANSYRYATFALLAIAVLGIGLLIVLPHTPLGGAFERCGVYSIMAWELLTAAFLLAATAPLSRSRRRPLPYHG